MEADAKKAAAPPPDLNITMKKATMATGSSSSCGSGSIMS
jgi:hypothetical protein